MKVPAPTPVARSLVERSAIVTGGSRGIGLEIARAFVQAGARVLITGRDAASLERAAADIGGDIRTLAADAVDEDAAAQAATQMFADGSNHILVNNAGGPPPDAPLMTMPLADFDAAYHLNLRAPLVWTRAAWNGGMRRGGGSVINIASIGGITFSRGMGAYGAAKAGLIHLTRQLAGELGPRVRVNAIAPGIVRTDATAHVSGHDDVYRKLFPSGRVGEAWEIARGALFLAGDDSAWITGETIVIDGGTLVQSAKLRRGWDEETGE